MDRGGEQHPPGGAGEGEPEWKNETWTSKDRTLAGQAGRGSEGPAVAKDARRRGFLGNVIINQGSGT